MQTQTIFREIMNHIPEMKDVRLERTKDSIDVFIKDKKQFFVRPSTGITCVENCSYDNKFYEVYYKVEKAAKLVKEYTEALKRAPVLDAEGLAERPFKTLAEFGNTVLAGRVYEDESNIEFVTWTRHLGGVELGHYFGNN